MPEEGQNDKIDKEMTVLQGGSLPYFEKRGEVMHMSTYEVLSLLFFGGSFLIALLAYLDSRNNKRK